MAVFAGLITTIFGSSIGIALFGFTIILLFTLISFVVWDCLFSMY